MEVRGDLMEAGALLPYRFRRLEPEASGTATTLFWMNYLAGLYFSIFLSLYLLQKIILEQREK